jgi:two-component system phosphate regulon response regulator PhoB
MARIFVVEDNDGLRETVQSYLELEDYTTEVFPRLSGVAQAVEMQQPDLIILDVMLPDGDGFRFARTLRKTCSAPIIFLTARTAESDRITGFEVGADDYLIKPFSMRELMLRVRAVLARSSHVSAHSSTAAPVHMWQLNGVHLILEAAAHRAELAGAVIPLTAAEWKILQLLADNEGIVLSRERILGASLDYITDGSARTVDTHIKNIRSKLGDARWIETVRGFGYRFSGERIRD